MKKLLIAAVTLAMAAGLVACAGGGGAAGSGSASGSAPASASSEAAAPQDSRTDFIWFKADMPEGAEVSSFGGVATVATLSLETADGKITVSAESKTAAEEAAERIGYDEEKYKAGDDVTVGKYTWKTVNFEFSGEPSIMLYADIDGEKNKTAYICAYGLAVDDPMLKSFLESFEVNANVDEGYTAAREMGIDDFRNTLQ